MPGIDPTNEELVTDFLSTLTKDPQVREITLLYRRAHVGRDEAELCSAGNMPADQMVGFIAHSLSQILNGNPVRSEVHEAPLDN